MSAEKDSEKNDVKKGTMTLGENKNGLYRLKWQWYFVQLTLQKGVKQQPVKHSSTSDTL